MRKTGLNGGAKSWLVLGDLNNWTKATGDGTRGQ